MDKRKTPEPAEEAESSTPEREAEAPVTEKPAPPAPTPEEELAELRDRYLRLAADFDNYRKRSLTQGHLVRAEAYRTLLSSILPAVDDLHLAAAHETADEAYRDGILRVIEKLDAALAAVGVERMDPLGKPFDPEFHECLAVRPDPGAEPGTVIAVHADGYRWGEVVLRPAQVVVAQSPADVEPTDEWGGADG
jgi:molecular chaperone GrpE